MNTIAMCVGYAVMLVLLAVMLQPLLRGLSYGLWETVVFYKCGVSFWRVFKRFLRALFVDLPLWGILNSGVSNTSNNVSSWSGIFRWSFRKEFTRAISKREAREAKAEAEAIDTLGDDKRAKAAARKKAMDDDV